MRSIRRNLLVALLGAMFVVMMLGGWATYRAARDEAGVLFDYQLRQIALSLRDQTFQGSAEALVNDESLDYVIRVWNRNGLTMYFSRPHQSWPELTKLGYSSVDTREGEWRVFATQFHGLTIAVAQPMRVRNQLAADAAWSTLKPFFVPVSYTHLDVYKRQGDQCGRSKHRDADAHEEKRPSPDGSQQEQSQQACSIHGTGSTYRFALHCGQIDECLPPDSCDLSASRCSSSISLFWLEDETAIT